MSSQFMIIIGCRKHCNLPLISFGFFGMHVNMQQRYRASADFELPRAGPQALAKQAKEIVRSQHRKHTKRKPRLRHHVMTLFYHFV